MKIYVGLISSDQNLAKKFNTQKDELIPREIREKFPEKCDFKFDALNPKSLPQPKYTIENHILKKISDCGYAVCMIEKAYESDCKNIRYAILSAVIDPSNAKNGNFNNFLTSRLTKLFKSAAFTLKKMNSSADEQILCLPRRNFKAAELQRIFLLYQYQVLDNGFIDDVEQTIKLIKEKRKRRKCPRFFIDDEDKIFSLGHERHAKLPTGYPHKPHCVINGNFRFGKKICTDRHYNVSKEKGNKTHILGKFKNCHDEETTITVNNHCTHLNMFSNDYFK